MNKIGKYIRTGLIVLAGLVILLHSIIPHHHHLDSLSDHTPNDLNTTQSSCESSNEAVTHCHAFNNILSERVDFKTVGDKTEANFILFFVFVLETEQVKNKLKANTYFIKNVAPLIQYFSSELSFRGPPSLI